MDVTPLRALLDDLPRADVAATTAVRERVDDILRPRGALRRLDEVAVWLAGWQATTTPAVRAPVGVLFAADHGVAVAAHPPSATPDADDADHQTPEPGAGAPEPDPAMAPETPADGPVSAYPPEVTAAMLEAARQRRTTFHALAAVAGADVVAVDVGVGRPTGDIRHDAALDHDRFDQVVAVATATVDGLDADLLVLGEMGIGNTTVAAALVHACLGGQASDWVGRGTGVDDAGLARKRAAVQQAATRVAAIEDPMDPLELLRQVGGAELVAMAAAIMVARHRRIPVVLDGYVVAAAALPLALAEPTALDHCIAGHVSAEPGHRRLLDALSGLAGSSVQADPLLDLDLRLGEGSGAMAAVPLIAMACRAVTDVPTFTEWFAQ